jgi:hypothetical protein
MLQIVASLIDTTRGVIYDHHMFIVQATDSIHCFSKREKKMLNQQFFLTKLSSMQMSKKNSDYYRCRQDWAPRQLTDHPLPEWQQGDMTRTGCLETQQNYKDCSLIFFSATTFSITTFSVMTLSIKGLFVKLIINDIQHN